MKIKLFAILTICSLPILLLSGCWWKKEVISIFPPNGDLMMIINLKNFFNDDNVKEILGERVKTKMFADWRMKFQEETGIDPFTLNKAYFYLSIDRDEGGIAISGDISWDKIKETLLSQGKKITTFMDNEAFILGQKSQESFNVLLYARDYLLLGNKKTIAKFLERLNNKGKSMLSIYQNYFQEYNNNAYIRLTGQLPLTLKESIPEGLSDLKKLSYFSGALEKDGSNYKVTLKFYSEENEVKNKVQQLLISLKPPIASFLGKYSPLIENVQIKSTPEAIVFNIPCDKTMIELFLPQFTSFPLTNAKNDNSTPQKK